MLRTLIHRSRKGLACGLLTLLLVGLGAGRGSSVSAYNSAYGLLHDALGAPWLAAFPSAPLVAPAASDLPAAHLFIGAAVRSGPGEHYLTLAVTETSADYPILGRSRDAQWWRIDYCGLPAWVAAAQVKTKATDAPVVQVGGKQF